MLTGAHAKKTEVVAKQGVKAHHLLSVSPGLLRPAIPRELGLHSSSGIPCYFSPSDEGRKLSAVTALSIPISSSAVS